MSMAGYFDYLVAKSLLKDDAKQFMFDVGERFHYSPVTMDKFCGALPEQILKLMMPNEPHLRTRGASDMESNKGRFIYHITGEETDWLSIKMERCDYKRSVWIEMKPFVILNMTKNDTEDKDVSRIISDFKKLGMTGAKDVYIANGEWTVSVSDFLDMLVLCSVTGDISGLPCKKLLLQLNLLDEIIWMFTMYNNFCQSVMTFLNAEEDKEILRRVEALFRLVAGGTSDMTESRSTSVRGRILSTLTEIESIVMDSQIAGDQKEMNTDADSVSGYSIASIQTLDDDLKPEPGLNRLTYSFSPSSEGESTQ